MSREIINSRQADLLAALAAAARPLQGPELMAAAGTGDKKAYQLHINDLRERELVHATRVKRKVLLRATERGERALADYDTARRAGYATATPARISWIDQPPYQTPRSTVFIRNNGHVNLPSRGTA